MEPIKEVEGRALYMVSATMDFRQLNRREVAGGVQTASAYGKYIQRLSFDDPRFSGRLQVLNVWETLGSNPDGLWFLIEAAQGSILPLAFQNFLMEKGGVKSVRSIQLVSVHD